MTTDHTSGHPPTSTGRPSPKTIQQIEGGSIALLSVTGTIVIAPEFWWLPLAAFLVFDLSQLGYLRSTRVGAVAYNVIHTYTWPVLLGVVALVTGSVAPTVSIWAALVSFAWAFHVGVDRGLGYGLKLPDAFTHTHLGWIGKNRPDQA